MSCQQSVHWNFFSSFIFWSWVWWNFVFFFFSGNFVGDSMRPSSCHFLSSRNMESKCLEELLFKDEPCLPWKCGCLLVSWGYMPVHRGGDGPGPRCCACDADLLHAPVEISACPSPPLSSLTVVLHKSVNKVCALSMLKNIFDWGIITLTGCLGFCCTITWLSHKHMYPFHLEPPSFLGCHRAPGWTLCLQQLPS